MERRLVEADGAETPGEWMNGIHQDVSAFPVTSAVYVNGHCRAYTATAEVSCTHHSVQQVYTCLQNQNHLKQDGQHPGLLRHFPQPFGLKSSLFFIVRLFTFSLG